MAEPVNRVPIPAATSSVIAVLLYIAVAVLLFFAAWAVGPGWQRYVLGAAALWVLAKLF